MVAIVYMSTLWFDTIRYFFFVFVWCRSCKIFSGWCYYNRFFCFFLFHFFPFSTFSSDFIQSFYTFRLLSLYFFFSFHCFRLFMVTFSFFSLCFTENISLYFLSCSYLHLTESKGTKIVSQKLFWARLKIFSRISVITIIFLLPERLSAKM